MLETAINYWRVGVLGHVYSRMSPYGHTLKCQKPNEYEFQIRLGFDALMGFERPIGLDPWWGPEQPSKGGAQGGVQGSPPKGLYKQRRGRLKTLTLATIHADEQYHEQ